MKYWSIHNEDWDYEDLKGIEILVFSSPDDFEFTHEILMEYFTFAGYTNVKVNKYGQTYVEVKIKPPQNYLYTNPNYILIYDNDLRKDYIKWLETKEVFRIECLPIPEYYPLTDNE